MASAQHIPNNDFLLFDIGRRRANSISATWDKYYFRPKSGAAAAVLIDKQEFSTFNEMTKKKKNGIIGQKQISSPPAALKSINNNLPLSLSLYLSLSLFTDVAWRWMTAIEIEAILNGVSMQPRPIYVQFKIHCCSCLVTIAYLGSVSEWRLYKLREK